MKSDTTKKEAVMVHVRFEVLMAVKMLMFWFVMPHGLVGSTYKSM
jgi:hypothetical protein